MMDFVPELFEKTAQEEYLLDVVIDVYIDELPVAASRQAAEFVMPDGWPSVFNAGDIEREVYRNVMGKAWEIYENLGFNLQEQKMSDSSCYFIFRPRLYTGEYVKDIVQANFRVSNHASEVHGNDWAGGFLRMNFVLNGYDEGDIEEFMRAWGDIGAEMYAGNFSRLWKR